MAMLGVWDHRIDSYSGACPFRFFSMGDEGRPCLIVADEAQLLRPGCFHKLGVLSVGVLKMRAVVFRAPDFGKLAADFQAELRLLV